MSFDADLVCGELQLSYFGVGSCQPDMTRLFLMGQMSCVRLSGYFLYYNRIRHTNPFI
jgi:hypothetical protein